LIGYQHWQEKYIAHDGIEVFPDLAFFPPARLVSNRFTWDSLRVGAQARWQWHCRWMAETRLMFVPVTRFEDQDVHYLRDDLRQDPSFIDHASGGFGVMWDIAVGYRIWRGLWLQAGYQLWDIRSGSGTSTTRAVDGDFQTPFNHASTLRQGVLAGLK